MKRGTKLGREIINGLTELIDHMKQGKPLEEKFKVTVRRVTKRK